MMPFSARVTAKDGYTESAPVSPKSNMLSWLRVSNLSCAQLCCQAHNLQQIAELTSTVDALKLELEKVKQVVQKQMEKQP